MHKSKTVKTKVFQIAKLFMDFWLHQKTYYKAENRALLKPHLNIIAQNLRDTKYKTAKEFGNALWKLCADLDLKNVCLHKIFIFLRCLFQQ